MEIMVSLSALLPSQYRKYVKGWKPNKELLAIFEQLSGKKGRKAMRIYFKPEGSVITQTSKPIEPPKELSSFFKDSGIDVLDYLAGTGKDSHGRVVRLGKALSRKPDLKKIYDSDPIRKSIINNEKSGRLICLSMHPYDIAGMSTDRGWVSCMNLVKGRNAHYVERDVKHGTLIAYLIDESDRNINKPIARCLLKPFFDTNKSNPVVGEAGTSAIYLAEFAYPDKNARFVLGVQDWVDANINPKLVRGKRFGDFAMPDDLYDDAKRSSVMRDATRSAKDNKDTVYSRLHDFNPEALARMTPEQLDSLISTLAKTPYNGGNEEDEDRALYYASLVDTAPQVALGLLRKGWGEYAYPEFLIHEIVNRLDEHDSKMIDVLEQAINIIDKLPKIRDYMYGIVEEIFEERAPKDFAYTPLLLAVETLED